MKETFMLLYWGTQEYKGQKQQLFEDELYLVDKEIKRYFDVKRNK